MIMSNKKNQRFQSTYQTSKIIHLSLVHKYSRKFNFFRTKNLNQIIHRKEHSHSLVKFQDIFDFCDTVQLMRRVYYFYNGEGNREILIRLKWLVKYYQTHKGIITFEYPTMFVTKTYEIFLTRLRRIHRNNVSLNQSIVKLSLYNKSTVYYLRSLSSESSDNSLILFLKECDKLQEFEYSFNSSLYDIYESFQRSQSFSAQRIQFKLQSDKENDQLIVEFNDLDYQYLQMAVQRQRKIIRKPLSSEIMICEIQQNFNNAAEKWPINCLRNSPLKDNENYLLYRQKYLQDHYIKKYGLQNIKEGRTQRRPREKGRMKQKAKQLLSKLKRSDYLGPYTNCKKQK